MAIESFLLLFFLGKMKLKLWIYLLNYCFSVLTVIFIFAELKFLKFSSQRIQ